ncbi:hypothetical protein [Flavobacterium sp.]|uniref:hypothetical protein n=1 Tax=Flavobacterium sp. TaxID=239 RepID=UPI003750AEF9
MAVAENIDIDLEAFELHDLITFLKHEKGFKVIKPKTIIQSSKINHFLEVFNYYSLQEIENLLPTK